MPPGNGGELRLAGIKAGGKSTSHSRRPSRVPSHVSEETGPAHSAAGAVLQGRVWNAVQCRAVQCGYVL